MSLKEVKDLVSFRIGFKNWKNMQQNSTMCEQEWVNDLVCKLYANQKLDEALEASEMNLDDHHYWGAIENAILSLKDKV